MMKSFTATDVFAAGAEAPDRLDKAALERDFDRIVSGNGPALLRLAASYTNTTSDRDDLVQEIAMALWQALPRSRGECSERTFLFQIAHNRAVAHLARSRSRNETNQEVEQYDPAPDPEAGLVRRQNVERLRHAIRRLPIVYRQAIVLSLEGLGYAEIAQVLGISEGNAGARLTRARQMLRELLENRK